MPPGRLVATAWGRFPPVAARAVVVTVRDVPVGVVRVVTRVEVPLPEEVVSAVEVVLG